MTKRLLAVLGAAMIAAAASVGAWAQDNAASPDAPAGTAAEQTVPDPDLQAQSQPSEGAEDGSAMGADGALGDPVDPAAPEAERMGEPAEGEPRMDAGEPGQDPMEETGRADLISDSSERRLAREDLEGFDCDALWVARNEIFDRNGYCFRSARAQEYFDNSDCTSDSQDILSPLEWDNVRLIQSIERAMQCR